MCGQVPAVGLLPCSFVLAVTFIATHLVRRVTDVEEVFSFLVVFNISVLGEEEDVEVLNLQVIDCLEFTRT